jgi:hypothetical protein
MLLKEASLHFHVVTHKAQNHHYHAMVFNECIGLNWLIVALAYSEHCIIK